MKGPVTTASISYNFNPQCVMRAYVKVEAEVTREQEPNFQSNLDKTGGSQESRGERSQVGPSIERVGALE